MFAFMARPNDQTLFHKHLSFAWSNKMFDCLAMSENIAYVTLYLWKADNVWYFRKLSASLVKRYLLIWPGQAKWSALKAFGFFQSNKMFDCFAISEIRGCVTICLRQAGNILIFWKTICFALFACVAKGSNIVPQAGKFALSNIILER